MVRTVGFAPYTLNGWHEMPAQVDLADPINRSLVTWWDWRERAGVRVFRDLCGKNHLAFTSQWTGAGDSSISPRGTSHGWALRSNGASTTKVLVEVAANVICNDSLPWTIAFWYYNWDFGADTNRHLFTFRSNATKPWMLGVGTGSTNRAVWFGNANTGTNPWLAIKGPAMSFPSNEWKHVVVTYNGAGGATLANFKMYWEGVSQSLSSTSVSITNQTTQTTRVGNSPSANAQMEGYLSSVRIYSRALEEHEIGALWQARYRGRRARVNFFMVGRGQTIVDMQATSAGLATVAGIPKVDRELLGTSPGVGDSTGRLSYDARLVPNAIPGQSNVEDAILSGPIPMDGSLTALSTCASIMRVLRTIEATCAATSDADGTMERLKDLAAIVAATTTVAAFMSRDIEIAASLAALGNLTGASHVDRELLATVAAMSAVSARLSRTLLIAGSLAASSTAAAHMLRMKNISGSIPGSSTVAGNLLYGFAHLAGTVSAASDVEALLSADWVLAGASSGLSGCVGRPSRTRSVAGTIPGTSQASGILRITKLLSSIVAGTVGVHGLLGLNREIAGSASGSSSVSSFMGRLRGLSSVVGAGSSLSGMLERDVRLVGLTIQALSTADAVPRVDRSLRGTSNGSGNGLALLRRNLGLLLDQLDGHSVVSARLIYFRAALRGQSAGLGSVAAIGRVSRKLQATSQGLSSAAARPAVDRELQAIVTALTEISAIARVERELLATSAAQGNLLAKLDRQPRLAGSSAGQSSVVGLVRTNKRLLGTVTASSNVLGTQVVDWSLSGSIESESELSAILSTVYLQGPYVVKLQGVHIPGLSVGDVRVPGAQSTQVRIPGLANGHVRVPGIQRFSVRYPGLGEGDVND